MFFEYTSLAADGDTVFLLDKSEMENASYGYGGERACERSDHEITMSCFWLRTRRSGHPSDACFFHNGFDFDFAGGMYTGAYFSLSVPQNAYDVCPAFNVDRSSVMFTSKVKDSSTAITPETIKKSGKTVTVPYTVQDSDPDDGITADTVSVMIFDKETGSMNNAARMLGVKQPSVSAALAELEKELGILIFERNSKGMSLTDAGREFLDGAKLLAQSFGQLEVRYGLSACYQNNL